MTEQYDAYGNRLSQQVSSNGSSSASVPQSTWTVYDTNGSQTCPFSGSNRICATNSTPSAVAGLPSDPSIGMTAGYDAAGNFVSDGVIYARYDAEGRMCASYSTNGSGYTQYFYDAEGNRVAKATTSSFVCPGTSPPAASSITAKYLVGQSGEQITELDGQNNWVHTNIYAAGALLATYNPSGMHFPLADPLGSIRVEVSGAGQVDELCANLPFGDGQNCLGTDATEQHFTGKERDTESGLDYFGARYYGSSMGRFMSPDPIGPWAADVADPQSWNFYAYARNNALINVDPTGLDCVYFNDSGDGIESVDKHSSGSECGSSGGDWVNGTLTGASYFAGSDTWGFQSRDSNNSYLTYANAPGSRSDGTSCSGDCDLANGYSQTSLGGGSDVPLNPYAQAVFTQVGLQTGPSVTMANRAFCNVVTLGQAGAITSGVAGAPIPKGLITSVPSAGGPTVSGVTSLASAASSAAYGSDPVMTGAAGQFLKSVSTTPNSFAGTARIGGAIGRVGGKIASSEAAGVFSALSLACIGGHP